MVVPREQVLEHSSQDVGISEHIPRLHPEHHSNQSVSCGGHGRVLYSPLWISFVLSHLGLDPASTPDAGFLLLRVRKGRFLASRQPGIAVVPFKVHEEVRSVLIRAFTDIKGGKPGRGFSTGSSITSYRHHSPVSSDELICTEKILSPISSLHFGCQSTPSRPTVCYVLLTDHGLVWAAWAHEK